MSSDAIDAFFSSLPGRALSGRYTVQHRVGSGGFGAVFTGHDSVLDRPVALKVLSPELTERETRVKRFDREAKILARIRHPNIVQVLDFGRDGDALYLVMELITGEPLTALTRSPAPLSLARVIDLADQILRALDEAHAMGVIHRDLKPDNILVEPLRGGGDRVKVVDFGISQIADAKNGPLTLEGYMVGTPEYMAPEQCRDEPIDARADLYAFGCVLYTMLCGRPPFKGSSPMTTLMSHVLHAPPPLSGRSRLPDLPDELEQLVLRCLAKFPEERPQAASALREELAVIAARLLPAPGVWAQGVPAAAGADLTAAGAAHAGGAAAGAAGLPATSPLHRRVGVERPARPFEALEMLEPLEASVLVLTQAPARLVPAIDAVRALGCEVAVHSPPLPAGVLPGTDPLRSSAHTPDLSGAHTPDVVLLSALEPDLERQCRAMLELDLPFFICGPEDNLEAMARALELGAYDFVPLPINTSALRKSLARAVRARRRQHA